ncbi:unnamed protein product [Schistosoma mattheei]|uniref:Uncharacterized protein n=1 Tax=Schistosoma mattheei TaxID=31246 RepID=A0A183Q308_9TREM|nr:unnamed protein product [Schistosoma mattheei]
MLKSSALSIFYGPETTVDSMETLLAALNQTNETEVLMNLYSRDSTTITESLARPQSLSSSDQIQFIEDYPNESVSGQSKECRPTSLFLPKSQDDSLKRESLSKIDVSESQHGTPKCSDKSKRRPSTWYRGYTEDESSEIIHGSSRKSRHLHPTTEESEALQLVLSSHAEPPKSSVTEKFAQVSEF